MALLHGIWAAARPTRRTFRLAPLVKQLFHTRQATIHRLSFKPPLKTVYRGPHRHLTTGFSNAQSSLARGCNTRGRVHDVGLGSARQFSNATPAVDIIQNAPLALRAALAYLDCPAPEVAHQAPYWGKATLKRGQIVLEPLHAKPSFPGHSVSSIEDIEGLELASTADLFSEQHEQGQDVAALEMIIPLSPEHLPSFPAELEGEDANRVLSPAFMHMLQLQSSMHVRHLRRITKMVNLIDSYGQLHSNQLLLINSPSQDERLHGTEQVFRIGIKSWTEEDLRQALGLWPDETPPWTSLTDWRLVHSSFLPLEETAHESDYDLVFPSSMDFGALESFEESDLDGSDLDMITSPESSVGPESLLKELNSLSSPSFAGRS